MSELALSVTGLSVSPNYSFQASDNSTPTRQNASMADIQRGRQHVKMRYDAAQTTTNNARHWENAGQFGLTADQMNSNSVRRILKTRSRYEYNNNGYYRRIVNKKSNEIIGREIKINIESGNSELNKALEKALKRWKRIIQLEKKLRTLCKDKIRDGEAVAMPYSRKNKKFTRKTGGVTLDLMQISCDRLTSLQLDGDYSNNIDGVILDDMGINPVQYEIAKHSDYYMSATPTETSKFDAEDVYHWFDQDYSEQHRAIPELTATLQLSADSRRYRKSVGDTAEAHANMSMVLEQQAPNDITSGDLAGSFEEIDLAPRMLTALPPGGKLNFTKPGQPIEQYGDFSDAVLREAAAPGDLPHNMVKGSSAEMNFSSARFDYYIMFAKDRDIIRTDLENTILYDLIWRFIEEWYLLNAQKFRGGLPEELDFTFGYEVDKYINPQQETKADQLRLTPDDETGIAMGTYKDYCATHGGQDWREKITQQVEEQKYYQDEVKRIGLETEENNTDTGGGDE